MIVSKHNNMYLLKYLNISSVANTGIYRTKHLIFGGHFGFMQINNYSNLVPEMEQIPSCDPTLNFGFLNHLNCYWMTIQI